MKRSLRFIWFDLIGDYYWNCDKGRGDENERLILRVIVYGYALHWLAAHGYLQDLFSFVVCGVMCYLARPLMRRMRCGKEVTRGK